MVSKGLPLRQMTDSAPCESLQKLNMSPSNWSDNIRKASFGEREHPMHYGIPDLSPLQRGGPPLNSARPLIEGSLYAENYI